MPPKKKYLTNKELLEAIKAWKETGKPEITNELGLMFMKLVDKYINHHNWRGYPPEQKEDMKGEALVQLIKYAKNFDPNKSKNPFAYFTQICKNAFIVVIKKQYSNEAKLKEYFLTNVDNIDMTDGYMQLLYETVEANKNMNKPKRAKSSNTTKALL